MRRTHLIFTAALLLLVAPAISSETGPVGFQMTALVLYQSNETLGSRVVSSSAMTDYVKKLQAVCGDFFGKSEAPENLAIVVAVRPENRSEFWLISSNHPAPDPRWEPLKRKLLAVKPFDVQEGPVAFALKAAIAGGDRLPNAVKDTKLPIPKEWTDAAEGKGKLQVPDGILDLIWPK